MAYRLGIDIGGTFTDVVLSAPDGTIRIAKILSSPGNYADSVLSSVEALTTGTPGGIGEIENIVHGTTVATNAILERRGARTGLITTAGFRDVLEIGRLRMSRLYDLDYQRPAPLVRRQLRLPVTERMDSAGRVRTPLDEVEAAAAIDRLVGENVESIAVCLLHSYANPEHEQIIGRLLRERAPNVHCTLSSALLPELGEFERTSTAVTNAYVMPVMARYLGTLQDGLRTRGVRAPLFIMQSNGGVMSVEVAKVEPVHLIESGPAAGVIATASLAARCGLPNLISVDMGGTTAKASVIENGRIARSHEFSIGGPVSQGSRLNRGGGFVLRVPAIDIAEVGAGGGSIVHIDKAGALRVGPRSAGATPGPICYDRGGEEVTLTDANLCLGYLRQDSLPSGIPLAAALARRALQNRIATPLGMDTDEAAYGVYRIGAAAMARAVRAVTVERGLDPREFSVVAFGGNGPLFAVEVARSLEIRTVVVPPAPGVFSAVGLLEARVERHLTRAFSRRLSELDSAEVTATAGAVRDAAIRDLASDNGAHRINCAVHGDLRYVGQTFGLRIALPTAADASLASALAAAFGEEHERTYGFRLPDAEVQLVNLRATAFVNEERRRPAPHHRDAYRPAGTEREAHFGPSYGRLVSPVLPRDGLDGTWRPGPLMVEEYDTVTLVPPGARARLDDHHNIVVETGDPE